jgi:pyruvate/2-oxoglutarate dehydrogenase complex dihydrolipoamide acyltransferase (E2) component
MKTARTLLAFPLVVILLASGTAFAGPQHIVSPGQVAATMVDRAAAQDADRTAVRDALARPEVRRVAETMGIDLTRLNDAVGTMNGADLERAATSARQVNQQLVGGASTVVISTTTIIIALLVVLLIVVAVK